MPINNSRPLHALFDGIRKCCLISCDELNISWSFSLSKGYYVCIVQTDFSNLTKHPILLGIVTRCRRVEINLYAKDFVSSTFKCILKIHSNNFFFLISLAYNTVRFDQRFRLEKHRKRLSFSIWVLVINTVNSDTIW